MIQVLKSSTFYSSRKSSLMTCNSTSSESLSLSWYFIFRQLSGSRAQSAPKVCTVCTQSLHSLHPNFIPGPLLHPKSAQSAPKILSRPTAARKVCTVCTQNSFLARCCTQSLHSLHWDPKMKYGFSSSAMLLIPNRFGISSWVWTNLIQMMKHSALCCSRRTEFE